MAELFRYVNYNLPQIYGFYVMNGIIMDSCKSIVFFFIAMGSSFSIIFLASSASWRFTAGGTLSWQRSRRAGSSCWRSCRRAKTNRWDALWKCQPLMNVNPGWLVVVVPTVPICSNSST